MPRRRSPTPHRRRSSSKEMVIIVSKKKRSRSRSPARRRSPARSPARRMKENEFYCLRRRKVVQVGQDMIRYQEDKAGRPRLVAYDGYYMYKYVKRADALRLKQTYPGL